MPTPGNTFGVTQGINKFGRISGDATSLDGIRYGYISQLGTIVKATGNRVPFLDRVTVADGPTAARGINDDGFITGFTSSAGARFGFVGNDSKGYRLLIPQIAGVSVVPAGSSLACEGINNLRQVVCEVLDTLGIARGFIGTPPSTDP